MSVYFIRAGQSGPVKIGTSDNVALRLAQLQCGQSERLRVIRTIDGGRREETALHRHYQDLRLNGEWFRYDESMLTIEPPVDLLSMARIPHPSSGIAAVIEALGVEITATIGIPASKLAVWKHRGRIPAEHWLAIVSLPKAAEQGVTLHLLATLAAQHKRGSSFQRPAAAHLLNRAVGAP